jgi:hypothetical protein
MTDRARSGLPAGNGTLESARMLGARLRIMARGHFDGACWTMNFRNRLRIIKIGAENGWTS